MEYVAVVKRKSSDELKHWKYIKREKVNGKWRYYYDVKDALGYDEKVNKSMATGALNRTLEYEKNRKKELDEVTDKVNSGEFFDKDNGSHTIIEPYAEEYKKAAAERLKAEHNLKKAIEAYEKTPLGKLDQAKTAINNGKDFVSNLFKNTRKKLGIH